MNNIQKVSQFIDSVKHSLDNNNYFAAIMVSLTLPDICSKIEYGNTEGNKKRYEKWIRNYFLHMLNKEIKNIDYLTPENIYQLRCSMLHEGSNKAKTNLNTLNIDEIIPYKNDVDWDYIAISDTKILSTSEKKTTLFLDVEFFCKQILNSVENWLEERDDIDQVNLELFSIVRAGFSDDGKKIVLFGL